MWKIDNSRPAPHFRVVSAPNDWRKQNKATGPDGVLSELGQRYRNFFQCLVDNLGTGPDIPRTGNVIGRSWQSFSAGYAGFRYSAAFSTKDGGRAQVELYIDGGDKDSNEKRFAQLESSKEEIESEVGGKFDWERLDDKKACRISVVRLGTIHDDQKSLDEIGNWMIEKLPAFKKTFGSRLAELVD